MVASILVVFAILVAVPPAEATPLRLPRFPLQVDGAVRGTTFAELDRSGSLSLLVQHADKLSVFDSDGRLRPGFPVNLASLAGAPGAAVVGAISVGDVTGDGKVEIALALSLGEKFDGRLLVLRADGTVLPGFPQVVPAGPGAGPSLVELDGQGGLEIVLGTRAGELLALAVASVAPPPPPAGTTSRSTAAAVAAAAAAAVAAPSFVVRPVAGFPARLSAAALTSPVAFGILRRGGPSVLAVGAADGRVHVVLPDGKPSPGFPAETRYTVTGPPAFGDLDDDGENDLLVASQDFKLYAFRSDGSALPGFPVATAYRIYGGPALGDLDGDGRLEVAVASSDGKLHAWTGRGKPVAGFPVAAGARISSSPLMADTDRDGRDELFVASGDGKLYGFQPGGRAVEGFPLVLGGELVTPALADYAADASVELVAGTPAGEVHGFRLARRGTLPHSPLSWPAFAHDATRRSRFGPNPARYRNLVLAPAQARAGEALRLSYDFFDLDGDPEPQTRIRWLLDGKTVPELDEKREVPGERVKKGGRWQVTLQSPEDFLQNGTGSRATIVASEPIVVGNTPPRGARVAIVPESPRTTQRLAVKLLEPATDVDGDPVTYRYRWLRDGEAAGDAPEVAETSTRKGQRWAVEVTPWDGELAGPVARAETAIHNTLPTAPEIAVQPASPGTETEISVRLIRAASDVDGDALSYRYSFLVNGRRLATPPTRPSLAPLAARRGDRVVAEAWAFDGEGEGPRARAEVAVVNSPPAAPEVRIAPREPLTSHALTAGVAGGAGDADGDPVRHRLQWLRNGEPAGPPNRLVVPPEETRKGERWSVEVSSSDGELESAPARAEVIVGNTPPTAPRLFVSRETPAVDEATQVGISEPSTDPDGDAIRYEYEWRIDGVKAPFPAGKSGLQPGDFRKNQRILVAVTAVDADGARSAPAQVELRPRNTPPGPVEIVLEPSRPTVETGLRVVVRAPARDLDSDPLTYRHRWYRNGRRADEVGDRPALAPGEVKRGDTWRVEVAAHDGEAEGPWASARAEILNVAPVAPVVVIDPPEPTGNTGLACAVKESPRDADGDPVSLEIRWTRNGVAFPAPADAATLPGALLRAGDQWECAATATDGLLRSAEARASARVANAAPVPAHVEVQPSDARTGDELVCAVVKEATDPDGDRVTYSFRWFPPAGMKLPPLADPARIPAGLVRKGEVWGCEVTASDGAHAAMTVSAARTIGNSPPDAPRLRLLPVAPEVGSELQCELTEPARDPDGDRTGYAFVWYRNGQRQSFAATSASVPGRLVKSGDRWTCEVQATDGEEWGPVVRSLQIRVPIPLPTAGLP